MKDSIIAFCCGAKRSQSLLTANTIFWGFLAVCLTTLYIGCLELEEVVPPQKEYPDIVLSSKCGMLQFENYPHFLEVYEELENRYESFEDHLLPTDTLTSEDQPLEDFEQVNNHQSYRAIIEQQIVFMEDNDIDITQANYPDSLFGGNDELKAIMNEERMYLVGDTIYYHYDECLLVLLKAEDCNLGREILLGLFDSNSIAELQNRFEYYQIKNICEAAEDPASRSGGCQDRCGISPRFSSTYVETDGGDSLQVTLTNITGINLTNAIMNFTYVIDTIEYRPSITFVQPSVSFKIVNTGATQCIPVRLDVLGFIGNNNDMCTACEEREICVGGPCPINFEYFPGQDGGTFTAIPPALPPGVSVTRYTWHWTCEGQVESTSSSTVPHAFPCFNEAGFSVTLDLLLSNNCSSSITQKVYPPGFADCCDSRAKQLDAYFLPNGTEKIWTRQKHNPWPSKRKIRAVSIYWKKKSNGKWRRRRTHQRISLNGNVYFPDSVCCSCDGVKPVNGQKQARRKKRKLRYTLKPSVPRGKKIYILFGQEWQAKYEFGNNYQHVYSTRVLSDDCP